MGDFRAFLNALRDALDPERVAWRELLAENERLRGALLREVADRRYQEDHGGAGASLYDDFDDRSEPWPGVKGIAEYEAEAREELARRGEG